MLPSRWQAKTLVKNASDRGLAPRVHPNGFIQLDLDEDTRLHVWPQEELPRQSVATPIHDHSFTMSSLVLTGTLIQIRYPVSLTGYLHTHQIWTAKYDGTESILHPSGVSVEVHDPLCEIYERDRRYDQPVATFHETKTAGLTATVMSKVNPKRSGHAPQVLIPLGVEPDNDFRREAHDPVMLWDHIDRVLARVK